MRQEAVRFLRHLRTRRRRTGPVRLPSGLFPGKSCLARSDRSSMRRINLKKQNKTKQKRRHNVVAVGQRRSLRHRRRHVPQRVRTETGRLHQETLHRRRFQGRLRYVRFFFRFLSFLFVFFDWLVRDDALTENGPNAKKKKTNPKISTAPEESTRMHNPFFFVLFFLSN